MDPVTQPPVKRAVRPVAAKGVSDVRPVKPVAMKVVAKPKPKPKLVAKVTPGGPKRGTALRRPMNSKRADTRSEKVGIGKAAQGYNRAMADAKKAGGTARPSATGAPSLLDRALAPINASSPVKRAMSSESRNALKGVLGK